MTGERPLRFGLVGCGSIGVVHADAIASLPDAQLTAVADHGPGKAETAAERYGAQPYERLEDMLREETLDAVTVCTPSGLHGAHAAAVMRSGRHVIVEKPMEISLGAADRMLQVQKETGVTLAVISQHRFDAAARRVQGLIHEGAFGRILLANAQVHWWRSQEYYDSSAWRGTWTLDGGGILMNQSVHSIDLLHWFAGRVASVSAYAGTLAHRMETEDVAAAALRFASGSLGTIAATTGAYPGVTTRIEVLGDRGSAVIERDRLTYLHLAGGDSTLAGPFGREGQEPDPPPELSNAGTLSAHALQIADFVQSIREDRQPLVDGLAGRHAVQIILGIYESAGEGREVVLA